MSKKFLRSSLGGEMLLMDVAPDHYTLLHSAISDQYGPSTQYHIHGTGNYVHNVELSLHTSIFTLAIGDNPKLIVCLVTDLGAVTSVKFFYE